VYNFILEISLLISLGAMIYLVARVLPRVGDDVGDSHRKSRIDTLIEAIPLHKVDAAFSGLVEKTLRRVRLILMKLDTILGRHLHRVRNLSREHKSLTEEKQTLFTTNGNSKEEHTPSEK